MYIYPINICLIYFTLANFVSGSEDVEDLSGSEDSDESEHGFFSEPESYDDFGPFFEEDDDDDNSRSRRALR